MAVDLSCDERGELERIVREQRVEARLYRRARMVLLAASGASISSVARQVGTNRSRVGAWLRRFEASGIEGLRDERRSGRPAQITSLERHQVIAAACSDPSAYGLERSVWSHESLADALRGQWAGALDQQQYGGPDPGRSGDQAAPGQDVVPQLGSRVSVQDGGDRRVVRVASSP